MKGSSQESLDCNIKKEQKQYFIRVIYLIYMKSFHVALSLQLFHCLLFLHPSY